jgi:imidazolonepropionase-like amidohydrolase
MGATWELLEDGELPDFSQEDARKVAMNSHKSMKKAYQAGVKIVMGTDSGIAPHGQNLRELGYLCDIGMTPMEAIQAGTKNAAELVGMDKKIGTLEKGKLADVIISQTDPIKDIKSLGSHENIVLVMKEGKVFKDLR